MNGDPLPVQHGYPLRLVVPGWYAVASVKWLTEIELIGTRVRSLLPDRALLLRMAARGQDRHGARSPSTGAVGDHLAHRRADVDAGQLTIRGVAWSGAAPIAGVEVSVGDGPWQPAQLIGERRRHSWQWWELLTQVDGQGTTTVRARATDLAGRSTTGQSSLEPARLRRQRHPDDFHPRPANALHSRSRTQRPSRSQQYCRWVR